MHIGEIYKSKPSQISEHVHLDDIFHAKSVEAPRQIQADNTIGKILLIGHAGAYQNYVTQIMADDDDEGDKGPKTIQEIRELANRRHARTCKCNSFTSTYEKSFSWGANPGINMTTQAIKMTIQPCSRPVPWSVKIISTSRGQHDDRFLRQNNFKDYQRFVWLDYSNDDKRN